MADFVEQIVPVVELVERARNEERERCAKIVEGEVYAERYRKWPQISAEGNRSNDCEVTKHCQALARVIRGPR